MIANWINENHKAAQIKRANENLRIALEAEKIYKLEKRDKIIEDFFQSLIIAIIVMASLIALGDYIVSAYF